MKITVGEAIVATLNGLSGYDLFDVLISHERRKLHLSDRFALWLGKHVRRWERV